RCWTRYWYVTPVSCPVLLTLVNEPEEEIEAAGVIPTVALPGEPNRRWLDRRVLRDVVNEARSFTGNIR
ncbi:putative inner membrane protein, partial [Salmonella enterica subsp. enterica serovar Typhimurium str. LT2-4]